MLSKILKDEIIELLQDASPEKLADIHDQLSQPDSTETGLQVHVTLDFDISDEGLENDSAHVILKVMQDGDWLRGGDWFQNIDVDHEMPLDKLLADIYASSWLLKATDSDIKKAIEKFCIPHPMTTPLPPPSNHDWPDEIPF